MKYLFSIILFFSFVECNTPDAKGEHKNLQQIIQNIEDVASSNSMQILYDVTIKPREFTSESQLQVVRFQKADGNNILNIPVFKNDTLLIRNMYYDLYKYSSLHGVLDRDSALVFGRDYSNKIMGLYHKLKVHEIQGGLPNIGELVIIKLITGERFAYIRDTSKIFNENWKERCFLKGKKVAENIYAVPE